MRSLDMDGPFRLTKEEINRRVKEPLPGNFALGRMTKDNRFLVRFVGRDDVDIRRALLGSLGAADQPGFMSRLMGAEPGDDYFKFSLAQNADAAFSKHCRQYHNFNKNGNLRNKRHPRSPGNERHACPVCGEEF
jgi:hypothetical protein